MTQAMTTTPRRAFRDRREAGRALARLLPAYRDKPDVMVLGLPRGGIPVAWKVAAALGAPLDAFVVRKLGAPGHDEFAVGALAFGGRVVFNDDVLRALRITPEQLRAVAQREGQGLIRREAAYRAGRPPVDVTGKTVIVVDDGLATGASMLAAVQALRESEPAQIVIAVPAAPQSTWRAFAGLADDVVVATMPHPFLAVGESYWDFHQVSDEEVRQLLSTPTAPAPTTTVVESPADQVGGVAIDAPDGVPAAEVLDKLIGNARVVLIGESSHGTHQFYKARGEITKWLIEQKRFCAVAAEADWPDAYRVNRFVRGIGKDETAQEALRGFERFPTWMWRNMVVRDFVDWLRVRNEVDWLRVRNEGVDTQEQAGFYGLDLYRLHRSMHEVVAYLDNVDPMAAARARHRYSCFDSAEDDGQPYGFAAAFGAGLSCEKQAVDLLVDIQRDSLDYVRGDGMLAEDEAFYAERNPATVRNAEVYYRMMFSGRVNTWNLRDQHMAETLNALLEHLDNDDAGRSRIVVWAHNSHVGDARDRSFGRRSAHVGPARPRPLRRQVTPDRLQHILGNGYRCQRMGRDRRAQDRQARSAGQCRGTVARNAKAGVFVPMRDDGRVSAEPFDDVRLARAIGVIYLPQTERQSHYLHVRLAEQFDAIIHLDETRALEPLELTSEWIAGELPETYPSGL